MVAGSLKSRTKRRVFVKTPGGKTKKVYKQRKPSAHICGQCGVPLAGIPRLVASQFKNLSKSKKRPQRPYGGVLCSKCTRQAIVARARELAQ